MKGSKASQDKIEDDDVFDTIIKNSEDFFESYHLKVF